MLDEEKIYCDICGASSPVGRIAKGFPEGWYASDNGEYSVDLCHSCKEKYAKKID